jgi:hypothetical protein
MSGGMEYKQVYFNMAIILKQKLILTKYPVFLVADYFH